MIRRRPVAVYRVIDEEELLLGDEGPADLDEPAPAWPPPAEIPSVVTPRRPGWRRIAVLFLLLVLALGYVLAQTAGHREASPPQRRPTRVRHRRRPPSCRVRPCCARARRTWGRGARPRRGRPQRRDATRQRTPAPARRQTLHAVPGSTVLAGSGSASTTAPRPVRGDSRRTDRRPLAAQRPRPRATARMLAPPVEPAGSPPPAAPSAPAAAPPAPIPPTSSGSSGERRRPPRARVTIRSRRLWSLRAVARRDAVAALRGGARRHRGRRCATRSPRSRARVRVAIAGGARRSAAPPASGSRCASRARTSTWSPDATRRERSLAPFLAGAGDPGRRAGARSAQPRARRLGGDRGRAGRRRRRRRVHRGGGHRDRRGPLPRARRRQRRRRRR